MLKRALPIAFFLLPATIIAGAKDDFIEAVILECNKTKDEAKAMATGGRQGTVMKYKTCTSDSVEIKGCVLSCTDASSTIGG